MGGISNVMVSKLELMSGVGLVIFFYKGRDSMYSRILWLFSPYCISSALQLEHEISHRQQVHEQACLHSNKSLFTKASSWICPVDYSLLTTEVDRSSLKYLLKILNCFAIDYTTTPSFVFKTTESNYYWD